MLQLCTSCIGDCFRRIVAVARRKLGIKNKYDGIEEYEEEEFSFPFIVVKAHHDEHQATQKSTKVDL